MAPKKAAKAAALPETVTERPASKDGAKSVKPTKARAKRDPATTPPQKVKAAGGSPRSSVESVQNAVQNRKKPKGSKCGLFKACGGGKFAECQRESVCGCCVHCNRRAAAIECAHCAARYHNSCLVQHFRMYGVCVCGMPLDLAPLKASALHCCYCRHQLGDFQAVFDCGHGACWSCWEKFKLRRQEVCAECGAAVVVHLGNVPLSAAV